MIWPFDACILIVENNSGNPPDSSDDSDDSSSDEAPAAKKAKPAVDPLSLPPTQRPLLPEEAAWLKST